MTIKTDGIVIREQTTGEQDRLITVLTRQMGVIKAFVNGGRNPKNKNASSTGLLCYSDFTFDKTRKDVYIVRESTPEQVFFKLRENIVSLSLAQYFAEITYELSPREEKADEFLSLILNALYLLSEHKKDDVLIKSVMELRLMSLAGYMPNIVSCAGCGMYESERMYISTFTGELFCENCKGNEKAYCINMGVLSAMRHICFSEDGKIFSFSLSKDGLSALSKFTERYLKSVTAKKYKTLDFYKMMTD